jgi:hypothetical protein
VIAFPLAASDATKIFPSTDFVELFRENTTSGGHLVYYGPAGDDAPEGTKTSRSLPAKVQERASCSTTVAPTCSLSNGARNDVCDQLVIELESDSTVSVP